MDGIECSLAEWHRTVDRLQAFYVPIRPDGGLQVDGAFDAPGLGFLGINGKSLLERDRPATCRPVLELDLRHVDWNRAGWTGQNGVGRFFQGLNDFNVQVGFELATHEDLNLARKVVPLERDDVIVDDAASTSL